MMAKKGTPTSAVTTPMGMVCCATITREAMSASTMKMAPTAAQAGIRRMCIGPTT